MARGNVNAVATSPKSRRFAVHGREVPSNCAKARATAGYLKSQMADTEISRECRNQASAKFVLGLSLTGPGSPNDRAPIKTHRSAEPGGPSRSSSWQKR